LLTREQRKPACVRLPTALIALFPEAHSRFESEAPTVSALMDELEARWPGMRDRLCDSTPAVRRHINVFVDGKRLKLDGVIPPGADVFVLTAVSGG
jgi:sulfur-carrier protein